MNYLTATLVILSLFSADQVFASSGHGSLNRNRDSYKGSIGSGSGPSQSDMELWESFGRWRRERGDRRDNEDRWTGDGDNRKREREGRDRWNGDDRRDREGRDDRRDHEDRRDSNDRDRSDRNSRDRSDRNSRDRTRPDRDYPPQPPVSHIPFPPLPIIIEPITPPHNMPSIIEPYPVVESTGADYYESASSSVYVPTASSYTLPSASASYLSYVPSAFSSGSSYAPILVTSAPVKTTAVVHAPRHNSSSIVYDSTVIITTPESTVTTSVNGRYRAMSNSAAGVKSNSWAGPISFAIVLVSSILIIAIV